SEAAQYSLPFVVACAVHRRRVSAKEIRDLSWVSRSVLGTSECVELVEDQSFTGAFPDRVGAAVDVTLRSGRQLSAERRDPKGDPSDPLSDLELRNKFVELVAPIRGAATSARLLRAVDTIEDAPRVRET